MIVKTIPYVGKKIKKDELESAIKISIKVTVMNESKPLIK